MQALSSTQRIDLDVPESYLGRRLPSFLRGAGGGYLVVETLTKSFGEPCGVIGWYLSDGTPDAFSDGSHHTVGSFGEGSALRRAAEFVNWRNGRD